MENAKGESVPAAFRGTAAKTLPNIYFFSALVLSALLSTLLTGCASPSEPYERKLPAPLAITDLAASQSGNGVTLTFTLPDQTLDHRALPHDPAIEIYRDFQPSASDQAHAASQSHPALTTTVPEAMVASYSTQGRVTWTDAISADDFTQHPGATVTFVVRTSLAPGKESPDSNHTLLKVFPVPDAIGDLNTQVTQSAVVLTWSAPEGAFTQLAPAISGYQIYRTEVQPASTPTDAATAPGQPAGKKENGTAASPVRIGEAEGNSTSFFDRQFVFGKTYTYSVRSLVRYPGVESLESADSNFATVTPKDTFPPGPPQNLVVAIVPIQGQTPASIDMSWAISPETDVAGYNVYRSDAAGISGTRLNTELLLTPAFRDMNVLPGRLYFYTVTAVDTSGNESAPGAAASGEVPLESPSGP